MIEIKGNLFNPKTYSLKIKPDAICITTNGFVKKNGFAVMGRGCAKQAHQLYPRLPKRLGEYITERGNLVFDMGSVGDYNLVTFPVKPHMQKAAHDLSNVVKHMRHRFNPGDMVPGWAVVADMRLIYNSAGSLEHMADKNGWDCVVIPRPGCGAGELEWEDVKKEISFLDDRFYVITFHEVEMKLLRVGVVGARARNTPKDKKIIKEILTHRIKKGDRIHLVSGGCSKGADKFAEELSKELELGISIHYPDKSKLSDEYKAWEYAQICYARNTPTLCTHQTT